MLYDLIDYYRNLYPSLIFTVFCNGPYSKYTVTISYPLYDKTESFDVSRDLLLGRNDWEINALLNQKIQNTIDSIIKTLPQKVLL